MFRSCKQLRRLTKMSILTDLWPIVPPQCGGFYCLPILAIFGRFDGFLILDDTFIIRPEKSRQIEDSKKLTLFEKFLKKVLEVKKFVLPLHSDSGMNPTAGAGSPMKTKSYGNIKLHNKGNQRKLQSQGVRSVRRQEDKHIGRCCGPYPFG